MTLARFLWVSVVALLPLSGAAADVTRDPAQRAAARAAIYRENPYLAAAVGRVGG